ncbi:MAG: NTP transferase domain-containing protein [Nitrososphaerota archaeon]|nr:NTP transferase domain-containing protein [Nitrososphaerota archaeon]MDG7047410.1 NTP transferase domain-containing protein [Nitrososphaerota archaeon]
MKGIILAGGNGTRLRPLTSVTNKHLLPVYDKPMLFYPLELLTGAGITEIMVVSGKEHAGNFMNLLGSGREFGVRFYYALQDQAGGIAEALGLTEGFAKDDNMTVVLGDNIVLDDISERVSDFRGGARIFLREVESPERFGVPVFDGKGNLIEIEEKPEKPRSRYAVTGLYQYDNTVFQRIRELKPSARGELEITDVNNSYLREGRLDYVFLKEPWMDAGTVESLFEASRLIRERSASRR